MRFNLRFPFGVGHFGLAGILLFQITASAQESRFSTAGGLLDALPLVKNFEARRVSSSNEDLARNGDARPIEPGATLVLGDLEGPGVITHLWNTCNARDPFYGRSLVLRIYWDRAEEPSVEVPLGDFFGVGHAAEAAFQSLPVVNTAYGRSRNCFWKMPFRKHAKVTVTNESPTHKVDSFYYQLDWEKHESITDQAAYFHARYRQEFPAKPGDYTVLDTLGRGHFVGMVYSVHSVKNGWFGEGDDRFYIDGETLPSLRGTGTEDYFGDAWGLHREASPFLGVTLWDGYVAGDRATAYRWHLTDPVPFRKALKVTFEHRGSVYNDLLMAMGTFVERPDWISSVAFWYQYPAVASSEPLPPVETRVAPYRVLKAEELVSRATPAAILNKSREGIAYVPMKPDAKLELDFEVTEAGRYQIAGWLFHSLASGRYQPFLDGKPVGPELDLNQEGAESLRVSFDLHDLKPGTHTLAFEGRGASPHQRSRAPKAYAIGVRHLTLLRLQDMEGYSTPVKE